MKRNRIIRHLSVTALACVFLTAPIGCESGILIKRSPDGHHDGGYDGGHDRDHDRDQRQAKRHGPPAHAPAHGYRKKFEYNYYPDTMTYYSPDRGTYFWFEGNKWRVGVELPNDIRVQLGDHVSIELEADSPYDHYKKQVKIKRGKKGKRKH